MSLSEYEGIVDIICLQNISSPSFKVILYDSLSLTILETLVFNIN